MPAHPLDRSKGTRDEINREVQILPFASKKNHFLLLEHIFICEFQKNSTILYIYKYICVLYTFCKKKRRKKKSLFFFSLRAVHAVFLLTHPIGCASDIRQFL